MEPEDEEYVGYLGGVPVNVMIPYFYGNPSVQIKFVDNTYLNMSIEEWEMVKGEMKWEQIGGSSWGCGFNI